MNDRAKPTTGHESGHALRVIAAFKAVEVIVLVLAGLAAFGLLNAQWTDFAKSWLDDLSLHEGRRFVARAAGYATRVLSNTSPERLVLIGLASFAYAGLRLVEGVGLWLGKRWAEYLTIIATASFLPFEIVAIVHEPSPLRIGTLVVNTIVVIYLAVNLVRKGRPDSSATVGAPHVEPT